MKIILISLICFPHYTAGGLVCDILSDTFSNIAPNGGIASLSHLLGKIGDTDSVMVDYDVKEFKKQISNIPSGIWVGTHCWPGKLPISEFQQIINITTTTNKSKCYRWLRSYHHFFKKQWDNLQLNSTELLDKTRETAKNYTIAFEPVWGRNVHNVEFADIVENTTEFHKILQGKHHTKHMDRWKKINSFLYDSDLWNTDLIKIFYQAELETNLKRYYIYE